MPSGTVHPQFGAATDPALRASFVKRTGDAVRHPIADLSLLRSAPTPSQFYDPVHYRASLSQAVVSSLRPLSAGDRHVSP